MEDLDLKNLPHLRNTLANIRADDGLGSCFHRSVALALDKGGILTLGVVSGASFIERVSATHPATALNDFVHAWVEQGDYVIAPTTYEERGNKLIPIPKDIYYDINTVKFTHQFSATRLKRIAQREGWSDFLKRNVRSGSMPVLYVDCSCLYTTLLYTIRHYLNYSRETYI